MQLGTLTAAMALPWVGRQIDKRVLRFVVATIAGLFGLACIYMGTVQNAAMLLIGFILLRMLGQGSLSLASTYFINQWWMRRRGTVLGISGVMVAILGLGTFPNIINWLIPLLGWRWTYAALGVALLVIMVPAGLFLFGERPERYGLKPDGTFADGED
jgi:sugar phosphate permease